MGQAFRLHVYRRSCKVIIYLHPKASDTLIVILVIQIRSHVLLFPEIKKHRSLSLLMPWRVNSWR
jgi:hypothetical protein